MKPVLARASLIGGAAIVLSLSCACTPTPEEPERVAQSPAPARAAKPRECPADPQNGGPMLPTYTLAVRESGVAFRCEFVYRAADTARGLMYRTELQDDHGMLFKLPRRVQQFWMRNTCLSLDMLFIDDDGAIVGILENVPPLNDEPRGIGKPTSYVLELASGAVAKFGLQVGQHLEIPAAVRDVKPE